MFPLHWMNHLIFIFNQPFFKVKGYNETWKVNPVCAKINQKLFFFLLKVFVFQKSVFFPAEFHLKFYNNLKVNSFFLACKNSRLNDTFQSHWDWKRLKTKLKHWIDTFHTIIRDRTESFAFQIKKFSIFQLDNSWSRKLFRLQFVIHLQYHDYIGWRKHNDKLDIDLQLKLKEL